MAGRLNVGNIACCLCGVPTSANRAYQGMCAACTATQVDITSGIVRSVEIDMCSQCDRFFRNPGWVKARLESAELMALCLRKLCGLKHVRLVDASWVWTEHHSRRLRIKLTVACDLVGASGSAYMTCLQQSIVVEYVVKTRNCDACNKLATHDTWGAKVQVRQKADHPRTLLALEQHMLKHSKSRAALLEVKREGGGLDFFFLRRKVRTQALHSPHSNLTLAHGPHSNFYFLRWQDAHRFRPTLTFNWPRSNFYFLRWQDAHRFAMGVCSLAPCKCVSNSNTPFSDANSPCSNATRPYL